MVMYKKLFNLAVFASTVFCLLATALPVHADAPLKKQLDLSVDQAARVDAIQKEYRKRFRPKRSELHRETRALRRARKANDSAEIARLEAETARLRSELKQIRDDEDQAIRAVLTPEQLPRFDQVVAERKAAYGSSRDEGDF